MSAIPRHAPSELDLRPKPTAMQLARTEFTPAGVVEDREAAAIGGGVELDLTVLVAIR